MVKKKFLATTRVFFSLEADFSITICVGIIFSLLSWRFGMRSIQNRSRKNFEKYACFAYVDYQTLGHDRKKSHPKKNRKKFLDGCRRFRLRGVQICNKNKIAQKKPLGHFLVARIFFTIYIYTYIYIYIPQDFDQSGFSIKVDFLTFFKPPQNAPNRFICILLVHRRRIMHLIVGFG